MRYPLFIILLAACCCVHAQPKHEIRAAWLTTVYALDWPRTKATSPVSTQRQKDELIRILDKLQEANFNTVLFQTRTRGDVLYPSVIEPFNAVLTGKANGNPGYDPLAFVIEECHKRGMECHAWIVAIPLGEKRHVNALGKNSVTKKQPTICISYQNGWYLNPGNPETKTYLMKIVREVITNYDVDGVHFDYLRYPENAPKFGDTKEFRKYGGNKSIMQWRRDNLTEIVRHIYNGVKELKPWVKVSTSPVGKYRDTSRYTSQSWNAYHTVFQDVGQWLAEGIQDQIYPMMYFRKDNFYPFALDWQEQNNGRHIIPGLGIYFLHPQEGNWTLDDIERQIHFIRKNGLAGEAHYRTGFLMENTQNIYEELAENYYATPALQPAMPWLDNVAPSVPVRCGAKREGGYVTLTWETSKDNDDRNEPYYVIYASDSYPVDTTNPENILAQSVRKNSYIHAPVLPWEAKQYYAVSAMDRYGNESEAAQLICP